MAGKEVRQIAIYGKGSIGKSTIASNISLALIEMGHKVMQIGCSPKADSTVLLTGGDITEKDILSTTRETGAEEDVVLSCVQEGYKGVLCAESGGPEPGAGCAGRGVALALACLNQFKVYDKFEVDFVIYDAIADVVCGGFGQPMKAGYAREVYLVTSGEMMSIYSANNICVAVKTVAESGADTRIGGLICNLRGVASEVPLLEEFAKRISVPIMGFIPRSEIIQQAEAQGGTVMQFFPDSDIANLYRGLAKKIVENPGKFVPTPITLEDIKELGKKHQAFEI